MIVFVLFSALAALPFIGALIVQVVLYLGILFSGRMSMGQILSLPLSWLLVFLSDRLCRHFSIGFYGPGSELELPFGNGFFVHITFYSLACSIPLFLSIFALIRSP